MITYALCDMMYGSMYLEVQCQYLRCVHSYQVLKRQKRRSYQLFIDCVSCLDAVLCDADLFVLAVCNKELATTTFTSRKNYKEAMQQQQLEDYQNEVLEDALVRSLSDNPYYDHDLDANIRATLLYEEDVAVHGEVQAEHRLHRSLHGLDESDSDY